MTSQKTTFQKFDRQIGGHDRLLSLNDGFLIVKPCNDTEKDFYENSVLYPDFAEWIPKYYGSLQLQGVPSDSNDVEVIASDMISQNARQETSSQRTNHSGVDEKAICIKNLIYRFNKPCIMDVKLGTQLWGEDADEAKRKRMIKKAENTTSGSLGISLTAFQVYHKSSDSYHNFSRVDGHKITSDTILSALAKFFSAEIPVDHRRIIIERFINDLESCLKVLERQEIRLVGASLFFVYEGDPVILNEALKRERDEESKLGNNNYVEEEYEDDEDDEDDDSDSDDDNILKVTDLKLIDFAHSFFRKGIGKDEGVLFGINNTINYFKQLLNNP